MHYTFLGVPELSIHHHESNDEPSWSADRPCRIFPLAPVQRWPNGLENGFQGGRQTQQAAGIYGKALLHARSIPLRPTESGLDDRQILGALVRAPNIRFVGGSGRFAPGVSFEPGDRRQIRVSGTSACRRGETDSRRLRVR